MLQTHKVLVAYHMGASVTFVLPRNMKTWLVAQSCGGPLLQVWLDPCSALFASKNELKSRILAYLDDLNRETRHPDLDL